MVIILCDSRSEWSRTKEVSRDVFFGYQLFSLYCESPRIASNSSCPFDAKEKAERKNAFSAICVFISCRSYRHEQTWNCDG